jgi:hypothetical protein
VELCSNPEKYSKSSKAMESMGSVEIVLSIWKNYPNAYVSAIVTDEDSTTRSKLSHSMAELVQAGRMSEAERRYEPKIAGNLGAKKSDHGELPLDHPPIQKLSDPIHFVKNYKSEIYKLVVMGDSKSETCKADAMRLSRNLAYMLAQNSPQNGKEDCTFEKFMLAGEASFEHHWNNHVHCGEWCQAIAWTDEEKEEKKGKFRDKERNSKEYKQQLLVKEKYLCSTRMRSVYHKFCNNKTEQIHSFVVNVFLPKKTYFSGTICGRARTYLAVSIDSLGFEEYYNRLYPDIGVTMSTATQQFFKQHDRKRKSDRDHERKPAYKTKRARRRLEKIQTAWKKEVQDKQQGHTYQPRMGAPKVARKNGEVADVNGNGSIKLCSACGNCGHQRRTSKKCPLNPRSTIYKGMKVSCLSVIILRA